MPINKDFLSAKDVAARLGVSARYILTVANQRDIGIVFQRLRIFTEADVDRFRPRFPNMVRKHQREKPPLPAALMIAFLKNLPASEGADLGIHTEPGPPGVNLVTFGDGAGFDNEGNWIPPREEAKP
jgi:hypothetical protein